MSRRVRFAGLAALGLALLLSGCARPVGDFGRAETDVIHDAILPAAAKLRSTKGHAPVSAFNLTDEEQDMRDRVWRFLVDPHVYGWFDATVVELQRAGLRSTAPNAKQRRTDRYYVWLHDQRTGSSRTRYSELAIDVAIDTELMPSVFAAICTVEGIDRQRGIATNGLPRLEPRMRADAAARKAENDAMIGWFTRAARHRYESYSYALDHLLVETPHEAAVQVNAALTDLAALIEAAERDDFCAMAAASPRAGTVAIHSRYDHSG